jgi:hypothetical protein
LQSVLHVIVWIQNLKSVLLDSCVRDIVILIRLQAVLSSVHLVSYAVYPTASGACTASHHGSPLFWIYIYGPLTNLEINPQYSRSSITFLDFSRFQQPGGHRHRSHLRISRTPISSTGRYLEPSSPDLSPSPRRRRVVAWMEPGTSGWSRSR